MEAVKRQLTRFDLSMLVVSLVIGMGIFRTPVNVAQNAGTPELFYTAWIWSTVNIIVVFELIIDCEKAAALNAIAQNK